MKKLYTILILTSLVTCGSLQAQTNDMTGTAVPPSQPAAAGSATANPMPMAPATTTATPASDPTLVFFQALAKCTPGPYQEMNPDTTAAKTIPMLQHMILGYDQQGSCSVNLTKYDGTPLLCRFNVEDMARISSPEFITGVVADENQTNKTPTAGQSLMQWELMQGFHCIENTPLKTAPTP